VSRPHPRAPVEARPIRRTGAAVGVSTASHVRASFCRVCCPDPTGTSWSRCRSLAGRSRSPGRSDYEQDLGSAREQAEGTPSRRGARRIIGGRGRGACSRSTATCPRQRPSELLGRPGGPRARSATPPPRRLAAHHRPAPRPDRTDRPACSIPASLRSTTARSGSGSARNPAADDDRRNRMRRHCRHRRVQPDSQAVFERRQHEYARCSPLGRGSGFPRPRCRGAVATRSARMNRSCAEANARRRARVCSDVEALESSRRTAARCRWWGRSCSSAETQPSTSTIDVSGDAVRRRWHPRSHGTVTMLVSRAQD